MVNSRLLCFAGMLLVAMIAVQADAAISGAETSANLLLAPEQSFLLPLLLATIVAYATSAAIGAAPVRRRRVNRARLRARRAKT
jgi:hypothetical protein